MKQGKQIKIVLDGIEYDISEFDYIIINGIQIPVFHNDAADDVRRRIFNTADVDIIVE